MALVKVVHFCRQMAEKKQTARALAGAACLVLLNRLEKSVNLVQFSWTQYIYRVKIATWLQDQLFVTIEAHSEHAHLNI